MPMHGRRDERTPLEALTPPPAAGFAVPICSHTAPARRIDDSELTTERVKVLGRLRETLRTRHYSRCTEKAYVGWAGRFLCALPRDLSPREAGNGDVTRFLSRLAVTDRVAASTQNQAFSALLFLFREVLDRDIEGLEQVARAKRPDHIPQVLTRAEVAAILGRVRGTAWLMASLMYGCGLRLLECCRLRVKDMDFCAERNHCPGGQGRQRIA